MRAPLDPYQGTAFMLRVPCHIREVENAVVGGRAHGRFQPAACWP